MMMLSTNKKILIVGLGLIGGSYAAALTAKGFEVGAITKDEESITYALAHNIIKHGTTVVTKSYVNQFDLIVFALYPHIFVEWINQYGHFINKKALVTDVTGVKQAIVEQIQDKLAPVEFIPAHPMAGREVYGVYNSSKDLFVGANLIITPTNKNTQEAIDTIKSLGELLEFKNIAILSPKEHDEMIGFLSQLTHCIAIALMTCKKSHHLVEYTGDSFRDLTRIAKINEEMWTELFLLNKEELLAQMDLFLQSFTKLQKAIASDDVSTIKEMMKISTIRRTYFDK